MDEARLYTHFDASIGLFLPVEVARDNQQCMNTRVLGNPRSTLYDEQASSEPAISPSGAIETGELIRLIGGNFEGSILPPISWAQNLVNGGTTSITEGELLLMTNGAANGAAEVQSINRAEFVTATFNKAHLAFGVDDNTATDVIYEWGLFDPVNPTVSGDGVFFRLEDGVFYAVRRSGGVDVEVVSQDNFINPLGNTIVKDNNIHVYELTYNAGRIDFLQDREIIHRMVSTASVAYETVHLTLGARIENKNGNTTPHTLRTRGFSCSRIGVATAQEDSVTLNVPGSILLKNSPGVLESVTIVDSGAGGASLALYDADNSGGTPFHTVDLTSSLNTLRFMRRLNFGLFVVASGNNFEAGINWR